MTTQARPDIEAISGFELSKAVAEALGKKVYHDDQLVIVGRFDYANDYLIDEKGYPAPIPEYATDANVALTLTVEGYWLELESPSPSSHHVEWLASYNAMHMDGSIYGESSTPSEAICRARLKLAAYLAPAPAQPKTGGE